MRLLGTVYVTGHRARLSLAKGAVIVRDPDGADARVPMRSIEAIVLLSQAQVSSQLLAACTSAGIRVTSLSRGGRVRFSVQGGTRGNVQLRMAQLRAADDPIHAASIARNVVAGKLQNSRRLMQRWAWDARAPLQAHIAEQQRCLVDRIQALAGVTDGDRIRGIEGDGARRYFKALSATLASTPFSFDHRNRRPPRDPVNALLSFTYGLVTAELTGALEAVGLDPQVGFLHGVRPGRPASLHGP